MGLPGLGPGHAGVRLPCSMTTLRRGNLALSVFSWLWVLGARSRPQLSMTSTGGGVGGRGGDFPSPGPHPSHFLTHTPLQRDAGSRTATFRGGGGQLGRPGVPAALQRPFSALQCVSGGQGGGPAWWDLFSEGPAGCPSGHFINKQ